MRAHKRAHATVRTQTHLLSFLFFSLFDDSSHPGTASEGGREGGEETDGRESVRGDTTVERGERRLDSQRRRRTRHKAFFFFFNVLTFNFNAMLIRLCVSLLKLFPANMFCHSHRSHVEPRRWFPHRRLFYFCLKTLLFPPLPRLCIAAAQLANIRRPQPHAELCSGLPLAALLCSFDGIC